MPDKSGRTVALIGLGPWGRNHARVLEHFGVLRAVWDSDSAVIAQYAARNRQAQSLAAVLDDPAVRAVVVATPARTHYEIARQVLESNRDVFVEKPLTLDEREGEELVRLARDSGRILMVGHITLYHPAIQALKKLVDEGTLGRVRYLYANRLNLGTVREAEDILWSFAPHDIAVFLHVLGLWPERVAAHGGSYLRQGRADVTVTHLEFQDGVRAHVFVSWLHPMKEHRLVVIGERKMALFRDGEGGATLELYDAGAAPGETLNVAARGRGVPVPFAPVEPLAAELLHFLDAIAKRREPLSGGRHGLAVLRVLETARTSLAEGGIPLDCAPVGESV